MKTFYNKKEKIAKLIVETPEDLWHIHKVLSKGDLITSRTFRKTAIKRGKEFVEGRREPMVLTIEVEKTEYRKETHTLKILGKIVSGPENIQIGSHHSINIEIGNNLTVKKDWKNYQIERLKKAGTAKRSVFICLIDRDGADFALLKESGIEFKGSKSFKKKSWYKQEEKRDEFYKEIVSVLKEQKAIVLAGPGFERENLLKYIKESDKELAKRIIIEHASERGRSGVREILRKSASRILKETRIAEESEIVEKFLDEVKKSGLAVYGKKETEQAVEMGAVKELLVSDEKVEEFERILDKAEKQHAKIFIISSGHDAGEQFLDFGGIGGLLRYRIDI